MRAAKAAFQAVPQATRERLNWATELTVREIVRAAQARLLASPSIQTRALYNAVAWVMNEKNGRGKAGIANVTTTINVGGKNIKVRGIVKAGKGGSALKSAGAKVMNPRKYGPIVEHGSKRMKAEPFMLPAVNEQKQPYLDRCVAAGKLIEQDVSAIGSRTL